MTDGYGNRSGLRMENRCDTPYLWRIDSLIPVMSPTLPNTTEYHRIQLLRYA